MTIDVGSGLLNALVFMGPLAIIGGLVSMYLWDRTCRLKLKVLLVKTAGGTDTHYVNKEGSDITLSNPSTGWSGTWPISSLATIPQPYPDLAGLLPRFLQKEIQLAIVIEGDWEPVLNRNPHRDNVASPNVAEALRAARNQLAAVENGEDNPALKQIDNILAHITTGPTRELIASPAVLGAIKTSSVMKALATVGDDLMDMMKGLRAQLMRVAGLNPTYVYILLALSVLLNGFVIYQLMQGGGGTDPALLEKVDQIHQALGIK